MSVILRTCGLAALLALAATTWGASSESAETLATSVKPKDKKPNKPNRLRTRHLKGEKVLSRARLKKHRNGVHHLHKHKSGHSSSVVVKNGKIIGVKVRTAKGKVHVAKPVRGKAVKTDFDRTLLIGSGDDYKCCGDDYGDDDCCGRRVVFVIVELRLKISFPSDYCSDDLRRRLGLLPGYQGDDDCEEEGDEEEVDDLR
jgi:hypothetical protein